jgi:hypothetical protein
MHRPKGPPAFGNAQVSEAGYAGLVKRTQDPVARYAVAQALTEVGLGSVLHALRVPLTGHFLSLNQAAILTWAARTSPSRRDAVARASSVSTVAALAKSFSPAGKRFFPMMAIAIQGWLYSLGLAAGGVNALGAALGFVFLSIWPFAQPLLVAYLLFGTPWFEAWLKLWQKLSSALHLPVELGGWVLVTLFASYAAAAGSLGIVVWRSGQTFEARYLSKLSKPAQRARTKKAESASAVRGAFRDLLHPWFIASTLLGVGAFLLSGQKTESVLALYVTRVLLLGFFFFWLLRAFQGAWLEPVLKRFPRLQLLLQEVRSHALEEAQRRY